MDNFKLNSLDVNKHEFIQADCLSWLSKDQGRKFDLIYIDPPTFSNSKRMEKSFDVKRDQIALLSNLTRHLKEGGKVIFCTNLRGFVLDESIKDYGFEFTNISEQTLPRDFLRNKKIHTCYELVFHQENVQKEIVPMVNTETAPKWQKVLTDKKETYHDYKSSNYEDHNPQRAQRRAERTTTNKVWGSAITSKHSTRKPSSFDSKRKPFSKAPERKVRVFGPNGVKDL